MKISPGAKTALCVAAFLAALCLCLYGADRLTRRDDSTRKYGPFFEEKAEDAYDVLFFGTSRVLDGILPMELWRDYGITSYNMGNNSECLDMTEWVLRLALEYHTPKVAVFDVYYIDRHINDAWTYPYRHLFLDMIPLSPLKVQAVQATLPEEEWTEFLFPFSLYHGRWEELLSGSSERQVDAEPFTMGAELRAGRAVPNPFERTLEMVGTELPGEDALRRIAQLCRERGVEPVFICIPSPATKEEQMNSNRAQLVADEQGVPFLNMLDVEGLIDLSTDCYDEYAHLNPDGACKVTLYLGEWLSDQYALPDRRTDADYAFWNERLEEYDAYVEQKWGSMTLLER